MARPSLSFSLARRIFLDRFVLGSLGHASYLVGSEDSGEALGTGTHRRRHVHDGGNTALTVG
jgi:hypothetical protein